MDNTKPILASSFIRVKPFICHKIYFTHFQYLQPSLLSSKVICSRNISNIPKSLSSENNSTSISTTSTVHTNEYHWYFIKHTNAIKFHSLNNKKYEWLHLLSLFSTRFIRVSWQILHDLQIAPPMNRNCTLGNEIHINDNEWIMIELSLNNIQTVACLQMSSESMNDSQCLIEFSPLVINDLHLCHSFSSLNERYLQLLPNVTSDLYADLFQTNANEINDETKQKYLENQKQMRIRLRTINYHQLPIANEVHFQIISSTLYERESNVNYVSMIEDFLFRNISNGEKLVVNDCYLHRKCIWISKIIAIPIISNNEKNENGRKMLLKTFLKNKRKNVTDEYFVEKWIYFYIFNIEIKQTLNAKYFRILPTVTKFIEIPHFCHKIQPRLVEYFTHILLKKDTKMNNNHLLYNYQIPILYQNILENILFPFIHTSSSMTILPSFLIICKKGHQLSEYMRYMSIMLGVNYVFKDCMQLIGSNMQETCQHVQNFLNTCSTYTPVLIHIKNIHLFDFEANIHSFNKNSGNVKLLLPVIKIFKQFFQKYRSQNIQKINQKICSQIIIVCSANQMSKIPRELRALFTFEHKIQSEFKEIKNITEMNSITNTDDPSNTRSVKSFHTSSTNMHQPQSYSNTEVIPLQLQPYLKDLTLINGFSTSQLYEILQQSQIQSMYDKFDGNVCKLYENECKSNHKNTKEQTNIYQQSIEKIRNRHSLFNTHLNINISKIPSIYWSDIGGLQTAKQEILNVIQLPIKYPKLFSQIKQSSGILLYGPPGTGKTLLAKAVATEFKMNFISIKGPELLNMYVGQSEENIRNVFSSAIESRPCILFFDEIDALAPNRSSVSSDSGNVMNRIVAQLLTEIDNISVNFNGEIFLIAATNRPDLLDASLLRPRRIDKQIYLGIPGNENEKYEILRALTRKFEFVGEMKDECLVREKVLRVVSEYEQLAGFTGADLYALCCDAMMDSVKTLIRMIDEIYDRSKMFVDEEKNEMVDDVSDDSEECEELSLYLMMEMIGDKDYEMLERYNVYITESEWVEINGFDVRLGLENFENVVGNILPSLTKEEIESYQSIHRKNINK